LKAPICAAGAGTYVPFQLCCAVLQHDYKFTQGECIDPVQGVEQSSSPQAPCRGSLCWPAPIRQCLPMPDFLLCLGIHPARL